MISLLADARTLPLRSGSVNTVVTSPPYWGQRDYEVDEQIGVEPIYVEYLRELGTALGEVHRVLRDDGTLWLNLGDSFNTRTVIRPSAHQAGFGHSNDSITRSWKENVSAGYVRYSSGQPGLKEKDLAGLPWRVALDLQQRGWYLRCDVIWSKPFGAPENTKDRPSRTHEYLFLLSKSRRYAYVKPDPPNTRSVWEIAPGRGPMNSAVFPDELVRRCLSLTTRPGDTVLDPFAGTGTVARVATEMGRQAVVSDLRPCHYEKEAA